MNHTDEARCLSCSDLIDFDHNPARCLKCGAPNPHYRKPERQPYYSQPGFALLIGFVAAGTVHGLATFLLPLVFRGASDVCFSVYGLLLLGIWYSVYRFLTKGKNGRSHD